MESKTQELALESKKPDAEAVINNLSKESSFKYKLSRKVSVGGKETDEITVNLDKLTGADMEAVAALPGASAGDSNMNEFSKTYLLNLVSRASGVNINELRQLSIIDGTVLTMRAQAFLLNAVSKAI